MISFTIKPDKTIYNDERKKLISYSTSGKNASATGVSGKIREMAEKVIADRLELKEMNASNLTGHRNEAFLSDGSVVWSLTSYRSDAEEGTEEWDELEMSILANAADEITVGVMGGIVEINAYKKF